MQKWLPLTQTIGPGCPFPRLHIFILCQQCTALAWYLAPIAVKAKLAFFPFFLSQYLPSLETVESLQAFFFCAAISDLQNRRHFVRAITVLRRKAASFCNERASLRTPRRKAMWEPVILGTDVARDTAFKDAIGLAISLLQNKDLRHNALAYIC